MADNRNYAALMRTFTFEVGGAEFELNKRGSRSLISRLAQDPLLAPFVEKLGNAQLQGGKPLTKEVILAAASTAAQDSGLPGGTLLLELATILPKLVTDLITEDAVVRNEVHREQLRAFVDSFDFDEDLDAIGAYLKFNLPVAYGPFVRAAARVQWKAETFATEPEAPAQTDLPAAA